MSRRLKTNNRGGPASQSSPMRKPHLKLTFGGKTGTKSDANEATILKKTKRRRSPSFSEAESDTSGDLSADDDNDEFDEESEEADDESDEPKGHALLHGKHVGRHVPLPGAGPEDSSDDDYLDELEDGEDGEWLGFPPDHMSGINDVDASFNLFDSDDDLVYEKVHDISDMEDDEDANEEAEEAALVAEFDRDMTSHFANQIDGMSAYGFGDNSDDEGSILLPFSSDDDAAQDVQRRVRFEESLDLKQQREVGMPNAFAVFGQSPAMARALLPSALPDASDDNSADGACNADDENDVDSDATEELETPAVTWRLHHGIPEKQGTGSSPPVPAKKTSPTRHRGPVRGTFDDDGEKATAILDPTGRKLLINDSHLLGGVFARKYGPSVPGSPSNSFASMLNESDDSQSVFCETPRQSRPHLDLMLSALNSGEHEASNGQASGAPEAFMSSENFLNDYLTEDALPDDDAPDGRLRLEDIIFDPDDGEESMPSSPKPFLSAPNSPLSHLNHLNVSAFKRKTEPHYFNEPRPSPLRNKTPHKRKRRADKYDSPYNDAHYQGVTPVQRITTFEQSTFEYPSSPVPSSSRTHKRRKTIL